MAGDRIINTGGGNYNEAIYGNYIENSTRGDHIHLSQDTYQSAIEIQRLLVQLQTQGHSLEKAKRVVAKDLVATTQNDFVAREKLLKLGKYLSDAAISGLIGEATVEAVKLALKLLGVPII